MGLSGVLPGWQLYRGISGSIRVEWVAGFVWNQWQAWSGIRTLEAIVVSDSVDTSLSVAAIAFYTEDRKLRFEVDLQKIRSLDVSVSSELLKLARIRS